jgi:hypothetical protein
MEYWSDGVLEWWSIGVVEYWRSVLLLVDDALTVKRL